MVTQNSKGLGKSRKTKLTDRICRHTKPGQTKVKVWCSTVQGFHLVVYPTGRKAFGVRYTVPGTNKRVEPVLGQYPEISLADARDMAFQWRLLIRQGIDPRQPENASQAPTQTEKKDRRSKRCLTVDELWALYDERYLGRHITPSSRRVANTKFNAWISPYLGAMEICDIKESHVLTMLDEIEEKGSKPGYVVEFKRLLGRMIRWGKQKQHIQINGNVGKSTDYQGGTLKRDRFLNDSEIETLWNATELKHGINDLWRLVLLCGTRQTETIKARWEHVTLRAGKESWFLPAKNTKTSVNFEIPLSRAAVRLLRELHELAGNPKAGPVFPALYKTMLEYEARNRTYCNATQTCQKYLERQGFEYEDRPPTFHDLRRNIMRGMRRCKVDKNVRRAVLNHRSSSMHETHYEGGFDPMDYYDEHRSALNQWAAFLEDIIGPDPILSDNGPKLALVS